MTLFSSLAFLSAAASGPQHVLNQPPIARQATTSSSAAGSAYTLPADADVGANLLPNIQDPQAVDAQTVCPGYIASNVRETASTLTADLDLAGPACNVYGNDVANLTLTVEFQADDRLGVRIAPRYVGPGNETWFVLPEELVPRPGVEANATKESNLLTFFWTNDGGTFSFSVARKDTGDTLFSTVDTKLVFEDQFVEFVSWLPQDYNLYGLGETMHSLRLGNNVTSM
jgi:alpha-glucosidase